MLNFAEPLLTLWFIVHVFKNEYMHEYVRKSQHKTLRINVHTFRINEPTFVRLSAAAFPIIVHIISVMVRKPFFFFFVSNQDVPKLDPVVRLQFVSKFFWLLARYLYFWSDHNIIIKVRPNCLWSSIYVQTWFNPKNHLKKKKKIINCWSEWRWWVYIVLYNTNQVHSWTSANMSEITTQ